MNRKNIPPRLKLQNRRNEGVISLALVCIFTVVNIILTATNSNLYFLFSAYIPYLTGAVVTQVLIQGAPVDSGFLVICAVIFVVALALYIVSWLLSRKKNAFLIVGLVLISIDMALFVIDYASAGLLGEVILDMVFHVYIIVELVVAIVAADKLKKLPQEEPVFPTVGQATADDTYSLSDPTFEEKSFEEKPLEEKPTEDNSEEYHSLRLKDGY